MKRGEYQKPKLATSPKSGQRRGGASSQRRAPKGLYVRFLCGHCLGCKKINNCGKCIPCLDMPEFGGSGLTSKRCILKKCHNRKARQSRGEKMAREVAKNPDASMGKKVASRNDEITTDKPEDRTTLFPTEDPKSHFGVGVHDAHNNSDLESLCDYEDSIAGELSDLEEMDAARDDLMDRVLPALSASRGIFGRPTAKSEKDPSVDDTTVRSVSSSQQEEEKEPPNRHHHHLANNENRSEKFLPSAADLARQLQEQQRTEMMRLQEEEEEDSIDSDDEGEDENDDRDDDFFFPPPPPPPVPDQYY